MRPHLSTGRFRRAGRFASGPVLAAGLALAAVSCSSSAKSPAASSTTRPATTTTRASTTTAARTTTTAPRSTTTQCPPVGTGASSLTTPPSGHAVLLTGVAISGTQCAERVTFSFTGAGSDGPSCSVAYQPGPFRKDPSDAPVAVAGSAFLVVRCSPAYGYDFETGRTTYTGPKSITPTGVTRVRQVVETGDFEGVLHWVIGLDARHPFGLSSSGTPSKRLVVVVGQ